MTKRANIMEQFSEGIKLISMSIVYKCKALVHKGNFLKKRENDKKIQFIEPSKRLRCSWITEKSL